MDALKILGIAKDQLSAMAGLVESSVESSLSAVFGNNPLLAQNVIDNDKTINSYEIDIDNSTYNILAVDRSPDTLLIVLSIQKINTILERIGDHAVNIAESAINLVKITESKDFLELPRMAELCKEILHDSLRGFFENKIEVAENVLTRDDLIDTININITNSIKDQVKNNDMPFDKAMEIVRISKNLERIADLSNNIAEETCFSLLGRNIKHGME